MSSYGLPGLSYSAPLNGTAQSAAVQMLDTATGDVLLTTVKAAERLSLSPRTLEAYRRKGGGPMFVALSRNLVRYRQADLDCWINARLAPHTAKARTLTA
jgi:predicted DNA-binding transcriptional regulator AlpA